MARWKNDEWQTKRFFYGIKMTNKNPKDYVLLHVPSQSYFKLGSGETTEAIVLDKKSEIYLLKKERKEILKKTC